MIETEPRSSRISPEGAARPARSTLAARLGSVLAHITERIVERPRPLFVVIFLLFVVIFGASIFLIPRRYGRLIVGDGIYYYVYLRSAWLDGDLDFTDDYTLYQEYNDADPIKKAEMLDLHKTPLGLPANYFSIGPAVLWLPVFAATRGVIAIASGLGAGWQADGYSYLEQAPLLFASIGYGFLGILLIYRLCAAHFSRAASLLAVLGVWLATNVVYYMGVSPSASHVLSLFAVALFLYLGWRWRGRLDGRRWLAWGAGAGLMALVRWQDGPIAVYALFELIAEYRARRPASPSLWHGFLRPGLLFALGALVVFTPQLVAWKVLYGSWLTVPQGEGFLDLSNPQLLNVWFSTKRGLFTWTPLIALAVIGFWPLYRRDRLLGVGAVAAFLLESYMNSIVTDWWAGESFGARRFICLMPFFALGLAAFWDALAVRVRGARAWGLAATVVMAAALWNNLFILQYNLWLHGYGQISAMPTVAEITVDKFVVPVRWLGSLLRR